MAWPCDTTAKHTGENSIPAHRAFNQLLSIPKETTRIIRQLRKFFNIKRITRNEEQEKNWLEERGYGRRKLQIKAVMYNLSYGKITASTKLKLNIIWEFLKEKNQSSKNFELKSQVEEIPTE